MTKAVKLNKEQELKLQQLIESIPKILKRLDHPEYDEIFGYRINTGEHVIEAIRDEILLKFLIANNYDVNVTIDKLVGTMNWRYEFQPLSAAFNETFPRELNDLGVITSFPKAKDNYKISTWNLYGNIKDPKLLFEEYGDSTKMKGSRFLRWRIGLMEQSLLLAQFDDPTNHKIAQVHDYKGVSFFRPDKNMRQATKEIIKIFGDNYPELLTTKFFVNIPSIMSWMFNFFTSIGIISKDTLDKFRPLNHGDLTQWFDKSWLPKTYGGELKSIFDLNVEGKIPEYGKIILEKYGKEFVNDVSLSVD